MREILYGFIGLFGFDGLLGFNGILGSLGILGCGDKGFLFLPKEERFSVFIRYILVFYILLDFCMYITMFIPNIPNVPNSLYKCAFSESCGSSKVVRVT